MTAILVLGAAERARIASIVEYAAAHPYVVGVTRAPGFDPSHVIHIGHYRCVFSITKIGERTYRHFSISCPPPLIPNQVIASMLAREFGLDGDEKAWSRGLNDEKVGILAQEITP